MIAHIVTWKLQEYAENASAAQNAETIKNMLSALPTYIPQVKKLIVSTEINAASPETDVVLYTEFANQADLVTYQVHPEHQECVRFISAVVAERRVVDYVF